MNFLDYLQIANKNKLPPSHGEPFDIAVVTNFTDDILVKILTGICLQNHISPNIYKVPYKQFGFLLKDQRSRLWESYNLIFFFFDFNCYVKSEFTESDEYCNSLLVDLENYVSQTSATVVINSFLLPYCGPGRNSFSNNLLFLRAQKLNEKLNDLKKKYSNLEIFDINRLIYTFGERVVRDMRGLYAFDTPFSNDFLTKLAEEWFVYVMALSGKIKKVIVLDLDNTLWGGVVGELGASEIALGSGYPGAAFSNFQRALLEYQKLGILLAINSKNNLADVEEVFEKNPNMILKKKHFAAIFANWHDKVSNLKLLSKQLNLGLDSFVFIDDDPMQRELVKTNLPEVLVPDLNLEPEQYITALYDLPVFNPFHITSEDLLKNQQYQEERDRLTLKKEVPNLSDFIASLNISLEISVNKQEHAARVSQLTLKTNQFNLRTRRYAHAEIGDLMKGGLIFSANVKDKFGDYGLTAVAIIVPVDLQKGKFFIDSFLMSCRILGRGVEFSFLDALIKYLAKKYNAKSISAEYIATAKNEPSKEFLSDFGFKVLDAINGVNKYELIFLDYLTADSNKVNKFITTNYI